MGADSSRGTIRFVDSPRPDPPDEGERFGPSRARVLDALRDRVGPATAAELAAQLGTHPNTARFHLEALCAAGFVVRQREDRIVPGRPRTHYVAVSRGDGRRRGGPQRSYRLLAEILAAHLGTTAGDPSEAAVQAGRAFGRDAASRRDPGREAGGDPRPDPDTAGLLVETLSGLGFASQLTPEGPDRARVDVTSCPFLEVATQHVDVVCAVHRGLMEGLLEAVGAPLRVAALEPLVGPSHCVARLQRAG